MEVEFVLCPSYETFEILKVGTVSFFSEDSMIRAEVPGYFQLKASAAIIPD